MNYLGKIVTVATLALIGAALLVSPQFAATETEQQPMAGANQSAEKPGEPELVKTGTAFKAGRPGSRPRMRKFASGRMSRTSSVNTSVGPPLSDWLEAEAEPFLRFMPNRPKASCLRPWSRRSTRTN